MDDLLTRDIERLEHAQAIIEIFKYPVLASLAVLIVAALVFKLKWRKSRRTSSDRPLPG
jgi:hypothetical protein